MNVVVLVLVVQGWLPSAVVLSLPTPAYFLGRSFVFHNANVTFIYRAAPQLVRLLLEILPSRYGPMQFDVGAPHASLYKHPASNPTAGTCPLSREPISRWPATARASTAPWPSQEPRSALPPTTTTRHKQTMGRCVLDGTPGNAGALDTPPLWHPGLGLYAS